MTIQKLQKLTAMTLTYCTFHVSYLQTRNNVNYQVVLQLAPYLIGHGRWACRERLS
jgi:hypothetical protein